jgi:CarD family transcriptional regulator
VIKKAATPPKTTAVKMKSDKPLRDVTPVKQPVAVAAAAAAKSARPLSIKAAATTTSGKVMSAAAVSVAERLSAAKLAKTAEIAQIKPQKVKLKLVAKAAEKIPVSKISRLEPTTGPGIRSAPTKFGGDAPAPPSKPVLAVRTTSEARPEVIRVVSSENDSFRTGDKIVYPGHGVGEVESVRSTVLGGQEHHIYNIRILDSGMKVMVPVAQATSVGLRRIIDKRAIDQVFEILKNRDFKIDTQTWNRRFREYSQKIKTGSVFEIAVVLRDLSVLSADKELSFGEKKMLDMAESLLVSEIAIAKARPHDKVVGELRALFA